MQYSVTLKYIEFTFAWCQCYVHIFGSIMWKYMTIIYFSGLIAEPVSLLMQRVEQDAVEKVHFSNCLLQLMLQLSSGKQQIEFPM